MPNFSATKVVGSLPGTLAPNTLYLVRTGVGFALYCSDATGTVAHPINAPASVISSLNALTGELLLSLGQELTASALDPAKKAGNATLSNGRRTVTFTAPQAITIGDLGFLSGKHCFAFKYVSGSASSNAAVGVALVTIPNFTHQIGYDLTNEVGMFQNSGNIYSNTSLAATGSAFSTVGDEVMVAVDCDGRQVWMRTNGGNWNGSPTANPATGVGGITVTGTAAIVPALCTDAASVWDFKPSSYAYPAPVGFGSWSSAATATTVTPNDVLIENPTTGQVLMFNGTEWYNGDLPAGGGGQATLTPGTADRLVTYQTGVTGQPLKQATYFDSPAITTPPAPAAAHLRWYARSRGGRVLPHTVGPSGVDISLQPSLFGNSICMWLPGTGTTLAINFGTTFTARNNGTNAAQAHPTRTSTNALTSMGRATFGTGTTATGSSGIQTARPVAWRGNAAGLGGFFFSARFGIEVYDSQMRVFVGLSANNAFMAADASTWANTIGIGKDSSDTIWQIMSRNASGGFTKTPTGLSTAANQVLDIALFAPPNGSSVGVLLTDPVAGTVILETTLTANLPVNTAFLYMQAHCMSVSGTTAKSLALARMYCEVDL